MINSILLSSTLALALTIGALAAEDGECLMTNTTCPCTMAPSSGNCMRAQGGNMCLLGECNDGYKCDCFGFEQCTISSCSIYTTDANAVPSTTVPFACHLTPDAGRCTVFASFLDTVQAADNAKAEASASVKEADMEMTATNDAVVKIQGHKVVLEQTFEDLDTFSDQVTEEERKEVEAEAAIVVKSCSLALVEATELQKQVDNAFKANLETGRFHRRVRERESEAVRKEEQERVERLKPENKVVCTVCDTLKSEITLIRKDRREAAIEAGTYAKKVQAAKNSARNHRQKVNDIRLTAEEARARCVDRSQRILTRLRASTIGGDR